MLLGRQPTNQPTNQRQVYRRHARLVSAVTGDGRRPLSVHYRYPPVYHRYPPMGPVCLYTTGTRYRGPVCVPQVPATVCVPQVPAKGACMCTTGTRYRGPVCVPQVPATVCVPQVPAIGGLSVYHRYPL